MTPQQDFQHSSATFGELIGRQGLCFYVPTYQRGFTWGSDQIERLFEDLFAGTDRVAAGDNPSTFLGSVIFFADKYAVDPRRQTRYRPRSFTLSTVNNASRRCCSCVPA